MKKATRKTIGSRAWDLNTTPKYTLHAAFDTERNKTLWIAERTTEDNSGAVVEISRETARNMCKNS